MVFTAEQIETIVEELTKLKETMTIEEISSMDKYTEFRNSNRLFYETILSREGINPIIYQEMIRMKRRLEAGEDQYSVDVRFGQFMAGKYIDPVIKTIPPK